MGRKGKVGWGVIIGSALAVLFSGVGGYLSMGYSPTNALYAGLQLFVMEASFGPTQSIPLAVDFARILAPMVMAATAIRAAMLLLRKEISTWKLSRLQGHVVICGLGREGYELVRQYREFGTPVVIIEDNEDNNFISSCEILGCHVLIGDSTSATLLGNGRVQFASELFLLKGDDGENLSTLMKTVDLPGIRKTRSSRLKVWLHIDAIDICSFLRNEDALGNSCPNIEVEVINFHEVVARSLIIEQLYPLMPLKRGDDRDVHLVIAGFGRLGKIIATRAVRMLVLPDPESRLKITVIDPQADAEIENLKREYPQLNGFCDISALQGNVEHAAFRDEIVKHLDMPDTVTALVLCIDDVYLSMSSALYMAESLWRKSGVTVPVFVRLTEADGWSRLLEAHKCEGAWSRQVIGFGSVAEVCKRDLLTQSALDKTARAMHEYYSSQYNDPGSPSGRPWDQLQWVFKDSNRQAADHILLKLMHLGLGVSCDKLSDPVQWPPAEPDFMALAQLEHRRWRAEREMAGWRFEPVTNKAHRVSKDLVDWESLDEDAREKDFQHIRAFPGILAKAGMKIVQETAGDQLGRSVPNSRNHIGKEA